MNSYAGDLTFDETWALLRDDAAAVLIDVRTEAEWAFVGLPDLGQLGKEVRRVEWTTFPGGRPNPNFVAEATAGLEPGQPLLMLCRSGGRSQQAAIALTAAGFGPASNVLGGFEGDLNSDGHRSGGWKTAGLPWKQS